MNSQEKQIAKYKLRDASLGLTLGLSMAIFSLGTSLSANKSTTIECLATSGVFVSLGTIIYNTLQYMEANAKLLDFNDSHGKSPSK